MSQPGVQVLMSDLKPTTAMRLEDRKGSLRVGREADISIVELCAGQYEFIDHRGGERFVGDELLVPAFVVRKGVAYHVIHKGCPPVG